MKVLHVIPSLDRQDGGPTAAMTDIATALEAAGVSVSVATTVSRTEGATLPVNWPASVPVMSFGRWLSSYKIAPRLAVWLWNNAKCFDVIHIHACFSFSSTATAFVARLRGVPYVVRPLGTLAPYGLSQRRRVLKTASYALIEGPYVRAASAVHCTSAQECRDLRAIQPRAAGVEIPLAVQPAKFSPRGALVSAFPQLASRRVILFLSRIDPKKNLEALLDAFIAIAPSFDDATLVIAGDGDTLYVDRLKRRSMGLGARIVWVGHVSGEVKSSLLSHAYCFVLPSFTENFGIAAAEALSYGLPVVLADGVAISSEVSEHRAGLVTGTDAVSVAEALTLLLTDGALRDQLSVSAAKLAEARFGSTRLGRELVSLYLRLKQQS